MEMFGKKRASDSALPERSVRPKNTVAPPGPLDLSQNLAVGSAQPKLKFYPLNS